MVFHEWVNLSEAKKVAYDVVHEFVCGFSDDLQLIVFDDLANLVFEIFLSFFSCSNFFEVNVNFCNKQPFDFFEFVLFFFEEGGFNNFVSYSLCVWFSDNCSVDVGLMNGINFSENRWFLFLHRF